jgi:hypothetical protein
LGPASINGVSDWDQGLDNFLKYIPQSLDWVVVYQSSFHSNIVCGLRGALKSAEFFNLEEEPGSLIYDLGTRNRNDNRVGFLEFAMRYPPIYEDGQNPGAEGLDAFSSWPQNRVKLCFDVTDKNFSILFSEAPSGVADRCYKLRERLVGESTLSYDPGTGEPVAIDCAESEWIAYTGFERFSDYLLPSGEVACHPRSVNGWLPVQGWIIGTLPFGVKYGRIEEGELRLLIERGKIARVSGTNLKLCADFEDALAACPSLQRVSEAGVGQSLAARNAASRHKLGYFWHERHFGQHFGLGAELPVEGSKRRRSGGHHLDLVLSAGRILRHNGQPLLE